MENIKAIAQWVIDYQLARSWGNGALARHIKKNIDREIKLHGLSREEIYHDAQVMLTADHVARRA